MAEVPNKLRAAKSADPNYCEALGRPCHSKACDFGCKELRGGSWRAAKPAPVTAPDKPVAPDRTDAAEAIDNTVVAPAVSEEPIQAETGLATEPAPPAAPEPAVEKPKRRRTRKPKSVVPETTVDLASLASGNRLPVLVAALAAMEHIDPVMSMAARMLGVTHSGTALDTMRDAKRRLTALIAELKEEKRETGT
jgi:hypothetical protein